MKCRRSESRALLAVSVLLGLEALGPVARAAEPALPGPTNEEIFQKVFKKKAGAEKVIELPMPVYYENSDRPLGMVRTQVGSTPTDLRLESSPLFGFISKLVEPEFYRPTEIKGEGLVEYNYEDQQWIPISVFNNAGYQVVYDEGKLEIRIRVPPELRKTKATSVSRPDGVYEPEEKPLSPSLFSAFVNAYATQGYETGVSSFSDGRQALRAQFDGAINFASWVLESQANYFENKYDTPDFVPFIRGDTRLVKDYPEARLRQSIGDLNFRVRGFQTFRPMGGVSLASQFGLQPGRLTIPTGNYEVILKRPSQVSVFINGELRQKLELQAGRHSLYDFPFTTGLNELRLEITDDLGQTEVVPISFLSSTDLLKPGTHEINYSVGAPSAQVGASRFYDVGTPTLSIYHRLGLTDWLTLGGNLQLDNSKRLVGAEMQLGTKIGFFLVEPAQSTLEGVGSGYALRTRYLYSDFGGPKKTPRTISFGVTSKTANFSPFTAWVSPDLAAHELTATYGQALTLSTSANLALAYQLNRPATSTTLNGYRVGVGLNNRLSNALSTTINVQQSMNSSGRNDASISFFLMWNFSKENQYVTASYNPRNDAARLGWNLSPSAQIGGTSAAFALEKVSENRGFEGKFQHVANRGIVALSNRTRWVPELSQPNQVTTLQIGTSLAYAGGRIALTRPIVDSFTIFTPVYSARGQEIEINPQRNGNYLAKTDSFFNDATLPELPSYNYIPLTVGTDKMKLGTSIGQDHFNIRPTYKSGYSIDIGLEATISLSTTLVGPDGSPVAMQPGAIRSQDDSSAEPITVFTGRRGQLRAQGFKPGTYELKLFDEAWAPLVFEIPAGTEGVYEMGKLKLETREK